MALHEAYAWLCNAYSCEPTPTAEDDYRRALHGLDDATMAIALGRVDSRTMPSALDFAALCRAVARERQQEAFARWSEFMELHPMSKRDSWDAATTEEYRRLRTNATRALGQDRRG